MTMLGKIARTMHTSLSERIASAVIEEKTIEWQKREKQLMEEKSRELSNMQKVDEHKIAHVKRECDDKISRLNIAHSKEIARLSSKIRELDKQLEMEKKNLKSVAASLVTQEKFYAAKISEMEHINSRLKKWIESFGAEMVRIQNDAHECLVSAHDTNAENMAYIKRMIAERVK